MNLKKTICVFLSIFVFAIVFAKTPIAFAESGTFSLDITKDNAIITSAEQGDIVTAKVSLNTPLSSLGGISFDLDYDESKIQYIESSAQSLINDPKASTSFFCKKTQGKVYATWDTTADNTSVAGTVFLFSFLINATASDGAAPFVLNVTEMFAGGSSQTDIPYTNIPLTNAFEVTSAIIPMDTIATIQKVVTITYPGSLADIVAAENAFAALDATQQALFVKNYLSLYTALTNARTIYNDLANKATADAVQKEIDYFLESNKAILSKTVANITLSDETAIENANDQINALSSAAKSRISSAVKKLLADFKAKINTLKKDALDLVTAKEDATKFIEDYSLLWTLSQKTINEEYVGIAKKLDSAVIIYGTLDAKAQALLTKQKAILEDLTKKIDAAMKNDVAAKEIRAEVNTYMKQWIDVLSITEDTVTAADESAIRFALNSLNQLPAGVQNNLLEEKGIMEKLLITIKSLKIETTTSVTSATETTASSSQIVETTKGAGASGAISTLTKVLYLDRGISSVIIWLFILLGVSLLSLIFPFYLIKKTKTVK